jgi:hypothetical protein
MQRVRARMDRQRLSALGDGVHVYVGRLIGDALMELARQDPRARATARTWSVERRAGVITRTA